MITLDLKRCNQVNRYDDLSCIEGITFPYINHKKKQYLNAPAAFDIETSSFYQDGEKRGIMYEWTFGICGWVWIGRTWDEFGIFLKKLITILDTSYDRILTVYVHNLAYEFQWFRTYFEWIKVFSLATRKPISALSDIGIEFKCSYLLSGYNLAKLGDELQTYKVSKKVGDLDYSLLRHSNTPLTDKEIGYCVNDVMVVMAYIQEQIELNGDITKIPLTKTGYVRRYCRSACYDEEGVSHKKSKKYHKYRDLMKALTLEPEEYQMLIRAFQGGFTHANPLYSNRHLTDVSSDDETSAYPTTMIAEQFPMSKGEVYQVQDMEDLVKQLQLYCCIFDVRFEGLRPKVYFDNYISLSRCWNIQKVVINNGRVVSADGISITITNVDYEIIKDMYEWDNLYVGKMYRYRKGYLPTDFVKSILDLYSDKTTLKDVEGKEVEYLLKKGMLNSCYGMAVMNPVRDEISYKTDWVIKEASLEESIKKYNNSRNRFLFYPWGVFVTAYARRNLFSAILEFGNDYVYADTDSIKGLHRDKHIDYFTQYNDWITNRLNKAMDFHSLPYELIKPKTVKGVEKPLGVWDYEGTYNEFKTLGAKRYMTKTDDKLSLTVSGLNKKVTIPYLIETYDDPFDAFSDDMYIPNGYTGKNTHTYIDIPIKGIVTDYLGNSAAYEEATSIHMEESDYNLSIASDYAKYMLELQLNRRIQ